jgi:S1-C subfamily serine protease
MAAALTVVVSLYGVPAMVQRIVTAVEKGRWKATEGRLKELDETSEVFRLVANRVAPAVVNVSNLGTGSGAKLKFDLDRAWVLNSESRLFWQGQGSGFVIDPNGYSNSVLGR